MADGKLKGRQREEETRAFQPTRPHPMSCKVRSCHVVTGAELYMSYLVFQHSAYYRSHIPKIAVQLIRVTEGRRCMRSCSTLIREPRAGASKLWCGVSSVAPIPFVTAPGRSALRGAASHPPDRGSAGCCPGTRRQRPGGRSGWCWRCGPGCTGSDCGRTQP